ncbi:MAG: carbohydrate-binding family 9-like protein [Firmicutes bacterium]|nr:carbohydrate-binding family 9-like protein [Bacillota bacterium]
MNNYNIKIRNTPDFEGIEKAPINNATWIDNYHPECFAQIVFVPQDGFYVKMTCKEASPLARFKNFYDPVYKDSCMEFFADFAPEKGPLFVNCEMNSYGTLLMGVGKDRNGRKRITEYTDIIPTVTPEKSASEWSVTLHLPLETLYAVYGEFHVKNGFTFKGNMYKCGDETETEHYLMWNPITIDSPDFHRPDYFGTFTVIE